MDKIIFCMISYFRFTTARLLNGGNVKKYLDFKAEVVQK